MENFFGNLMIAGSLMIIAWHGEPCLIDAIIYFLMK
jgi:hypothetical protein